MEDKEKRFRNFLLNAIIIVAIIAVGLFAVNQTLEYRYRAEFLQTPCSICSKLNPNVSNCLEGCFTFKQTLYPDGFGNWYNPSLKDPRYNYTLNLTPK